MVCNYGSDEFGVYMTGSFKMEKVLTASQKYLFWALDNFQRFKFLNFRQVSSLDYQSRHRITRACSG